MSLSQEVSGSGRREAAAAGAADYYSQFASMYELFFRDYDGSMQEEGRWLTQVLGPGPGRVLDACCGTGRQAIPLSEAGFTVTALDPCAAMIERARDLAGPEAARITWVQAEFEVIGERVNGPFDWVIALGNGLAHARDLAAVARALTRLRSLTGSEGHVIIGIKDFDLSLRLRRTLHLHPPRYADGRLEQLFQVWRFNDPELAVSTHHITTDPQGLVRHTVTPTTEVILTLRRLTEATSLAGFSRLERLDHPAEARYRLH